MITGTSVALLMGASPQIAASILPKSVTTPIAMAVGGSIGGIPAISAVCVIFVGILGAVFGHTLLNIMKIRTKAARGLAMGTASHALGTARCAELDYQEGAFSSLALVICGIITSLVAPFIFPIILAVSGLKFAMRRANFIYHCNNEKLHTVMRFGSHMKGRDGSVHYRIPLHR